jgi:hypothetical protein
MSYLGVFHETILSLGPDGPDESSYIAMAVMLLIVVVIVFISKGVSAATKGRGNPVAQSAVRSAPAQSSKLEVVNSAKPSPRGDNRGETTVYLMSHLEFSAAKIGVTSSISQADRIQSHRERGWLLNNSWILPTLGDAVAVEGAVLAWWRNELRLSPACSASSMPQGGHTETVSLHSLPIEQIREKVISLIATASMEALNPASISDLIPGTYARITGTIKAASGVRAYRTKSGWQRWIVEDEYGCLVVEVSGRNQVRKEFLNPGRGIEVEGRVEIMRNTLNLGKGETLFLMTNPKFILRPFDALVRRSSGTIKSPEPWTREQKDRLWRAKQRRRYGESE